VFNSLFTQAVVFTAAALLIFSSLTWFFFFSPVRERSLAPVSHPSAGLTNLVVAFLGVSTFLMVGGGLWDAGMHIQTGIVPGGKDFLWPPHLMIYGAFLLAFLVAFTTTGYVAWHGWRSGNRDPRRWVRANPFLGAVAMAATYALLSIPGDALWHELFGIDLTAWSPPHILIALMISVVSLSAVALWLQNSELSRRSFIRDLVTMTLIAGTLNILYLVGVLEWETVKGRSAFVAARPLWLYPLVGGGAALVMLLLVKKLTRFLWSATLTAFIFYAFRLGVSYLLTAFGSIAPIFPLVFLLGAFLLDVLPWEMIHNSWLRVVAQAAAFTAGYLPVAMIFLVQRNDLPRFTGLDWVAVFGLTLVLAVFFAPLVNWVGRRFIQTSAPA
jgi:hypothetical protein